MKKEQEEGTQVTDMEQKKAYTAPEAEIVEVVVERGFWGSSDFPNT